MRKALVLPLLLGSFLCLACSEPTGSERRTLVGRWMSSGFTPATVQLAITEVARSVEGAGSWSDPARAAAFRVSGAHAGETVSLLLEFEDSPDVNFLGEFSDEDTLAGTLTGGEFRDRPITFVRVEEVED